MAAETPLVIVGKNCGSEYGKKEALSKAKSGLGRASQLGAGSEVDLPIKRK
jgi:hypothetical protein